MLAFIFGVVLAFAAADSSADVLSCSQCRVVTGTVAEISDRAMNLTALSESQFVASANPVVYGEYATFEAEIQHRNINRGTHRIEVDRHDKTTCVVHLSMEVEAHIPKRFRWNGRPRTIVNRMIRQRAHERFVREARNVFNLEWEILCDD